MPAHQALSTITKLLDPFVKKLLKNTGDALITCTVEYVEKNRPVETKPVTISNAMSKLYVPKLASYPFRPSETDFVRHPTDLPCPTCKAYSQHPCIADGDLVQFEGNGITIADKVFVHRARLALHIRYVELYSDLTVKK
jgi:hypothetical protein